MIWWITKIIIIIVDINIRAKYKIFKFPLAISVNIILKFINGIIDKIALLLIFNKNTIIPGKNAINVSGVRALCASLKDADILAIAIHNPLIIIEKAIIIIII